MPSYDAATRVASRLDRVSTLSAHYPAGGSPEGLAVDEARNLAVTRFMYHEIWLFSKKCVALCQVVPAPERYVTNLAYGRKGNKTLHITESETGTILAAKMEVPGKIMYAHL